MTTFRKTRKIQIYEIRNNLKKQILIAKTTNRSNKEEEKDEIGRKTPGNDRIVLCFLDSVVVKPSSFAIRNLVEILRIEATKILCDFRQSCRLLCSFFTSSAPSHFE